MAQIINCPSCQRKLQVPESLVGQDVQCPNCGTTFVAGTVGGKSASLATQSSVPPPLPTGGPAEDEDFPPPTSRKRPKQDEEEWEENGFDDDLEERPRRRKKTSRASEEEIKEFAGKKVAAGVCGILIGSLGIHKFILGLNTPGLIMLLSTIFTCGIAGAVTGVIGLVEGIIYLTKSDEEFYELYAVEKKGWF